MKRLKCVTILFVMLFSLIHPFYAYANKLIFTVPFTSVNLAPNTALAAPFSFGINKIIFCYVDTMNQNTGVITWPYLGVRQNSTLPIFLKTQSNIQGSFSDAAGFITILNNTNQNMSVSCQFAF